MVWMKMQKKKYETPSRPWDKGRMEREGELLKKFGLRRKKEVWMAEARVRKFRRMAREIAATHDKERGLMLTRKMVRLGMLGEGATLDDVLGLTVENLLERRLQTMVKSRNMANTLGQSRQMITHGHVRINDRRATYPSYIVPREEEALISTDLSVAKPKPVQEAKEGEKEDG